MVATTVSYREFLLRLALLMGTTYWKREGTVLQVIQMFMIPEKINWFLGHNWKKAFSIMGFFLTVTWCLKIWLIFLMPAPTKYDCTFDAPTACQWTQDSSNDQFDWRIHSGGTSSGFTGPKYDHTLQNSRGKNTHYKWVYIATDLYSKTLVFFNFIVEENL